MVFSPQGTKITGVRYVVRYIKLASFSYVQPYEYCATHPHGLSTLRGAMKFRKTVRFIAGTIRCFSHYPYFPFGSGLSETGGFLPPTIAKDVS